MRFVSWPAADLVRAFDFKLPVEGPAHRRRHPARRRSAPEGEAALEAGAGRALGRAFTEARVKARWSPRATQVHGSPGPAGRRPGALQGQPSATTGSTTARRRSPGSSCPPSRASARAPPSRCRCSAACSGRSPCRAPLSRPRLLGPPPLPAPLRGRRGPGRPRGALRGSRRRGDLGEGHLPLRPGRPEPRGARGSDRALHGRAGPRPRATRASTPSCARPSRPLPSTLGCARRGSCGPTVPWREPRELRAEVTLDHLDVLAPDYPGRTTTPVRARFEKGVLTVEDFAIAARRHRPLVAGSRRPLRRRASSTSRPRGPRTCGDSSRVSPRLRGFGAARLDVAVNGTWAEPRVLGTLAARGRGGAGARLSPRPRGPHGDRALHRGRGDPRRGQGHAGGRPPRSRRPDRLRGGPALLLRPAAARRGPCLALARGAAEPGRRRPALLRRRRAAAS